MSLMSKSESIEAVKSQFDNCRPHLEMIGQVSLPSATIATWKCNDCGKTYTTKD